MNPEAVETTDKIINALTQLANKLGTTVEQLWPMLVQQQRLEGITVVVMIALVFTVSLLILRNVKDKEWFDETKNSDPPTTAGVLGLVSTIGFIGSIVFLVFGSKWIVTSIFNPEYWALKDIADMLK